MSPLPSTGIEGDTASRNAAIADQSAAPEYSCSAVRACNEIAAAPGVFGAARGGEIGERVVVDAFAHLDRDRHGARGSHRRGDDAAEQHMVEWEGRTAADSVHFLRRATEIQVEVVDAKFVDGVPYGRVHDAGIDAVELETAHRFVDAERDHCCGCGVAFDECARRHHLADVQRSAVAATDLPERRVRDTGHRREHHRWVDRDRSDLQRHRSVISTSISFSRLRKRGSDSPMTLPWSPSMPSMKGAANPSSVKAPATRTGSPVSRYASSSAVVGVPNRTTVRATALACLPVADVDHAMTRHQHALTARHRQPSFAGDAALTPACPSARR